MFTGYRYTLNQEESKWEPEVINSIIETYGQDWEGSGLINASDHCTTCTIETGCQKQVGSD